MRRDTLNFYNGKRVLITGNTGFKGSWLSQILLLAGAEVCGYALAPESGGLYEQLQLDKQMRSVEGDIRDIDMLWRTVHDFRPEIVLHLAAQPIVRVGYKDPVGTYSTNVMGTVHILDCVRRSDSVRSFLNVTTDKVYQNVEWVWGYREDDRLNGEDPYSNSKSCSELITDCYNHSFFNSRDAAVSTARAGNVIGGGDYAKDRILPDCVRAASKGETILLRNPEAVRPYQHVLEPLSAYLLIVESQWRDSAAAGAYNVGPAAADCITTWQIAELFCRFWGPDASCAVAVQSGGGPHEANLLRLDSSRITQALGWKPRWNIERAVEETVRWYQAARSGEARSVTERQIQEFFCA